MVVKQINSVSVQKFKEDINIDLKENLSRKFYRGYVVLENEEDVTPLACGTWKYQDSGDKNVLDELRIDHFSIRDEEAGKLLLKELEKSTWQGHIRRCYMEAHLEGKEREIEFLKKAGFSLSRGESRILTVNVGDLDLPRVVKVPSYVSPIADMDTRTYKRGVMNVLYHLGMDEIMDFNYLPKGWFDQHVSFSASKNGEGVGFILVHELPSGSLRISSMMAMGEKANRILLSLMACSTSKVIELYSEKTHILINRRNKKIRVICDKLFPGIRGKEVLKLERKEE